MATVSLADLIEETLSVLYRVTERPFQVSIGSNDLTDAVDTSLTLVSADAVVPPVPIEFGQELVLVTDKAEDGTLTVSRGYAATPASAHAAGSVGLVNPQWPRREVRRALLRAFSGPLNTHLPKITSAVYTPTSQKYYVELPADVLRVFRVAINEWTDAGVPIKQWLELDQWDFVQDAPTTVVASGQLLSFSPTWASPLLNTTQKLLVTHQVPYAWSGGTNDPAEAETIDLPFGGEDLPALFAAAYLTARRELTRLEVDKIEEWSQEASIRQGINLRAVRELWSEFYRRVDETRRLKPVRRHRPFRKMSRR